MSNNSTSALKNEAPIDPQLTRPSIPHTTSQASDSSTVNPSPKQDIATGSSGLTLSTRNRMPYFRYFGPTAIVPGLRQMVVKVRGKQHGSAQTTSDRTYYPGLGAEYCRVQNLSPKRLNLNCC